jgi:hypothetical protein
MKEHETKCNPKHDGRNVKLARKCLGLIRDIADRGAMSWDPEIVGYALQELSQVLLERTRTEDRIESSNPLRPARFPTLPRYIWNWNL